MVTTFLFSRVTGLRDVTVSFKQTDLCLRVTYFNVPQQEHIPCYDDVLLAEGDSYSRMEKKKKTEKTEQTKQIYHGHRAHIEWMFTKGNLPLTQSIIGQIICILHKNKPQRHRLISHLATARAS